MFVKDLLKDKVIIITGGGTGLGKAMGIRFAELGAKLVLMSRGQEHLDSGAAEMKKVGAEVLTLACDIRDHEAVEENIKKAAAHFGKIDGLVNNAAGNIAAPTERISANAFNAVVGIVLNGTFNCTHAVGKWMIENKHPGRILSITTTYAWTGSGYVVPSACAKAGVLALMRSLAVEWGRYGIRLNAVAPGPIPTKGAWEKLMPPGFDDILAERNPTGRVGTPEELANLCTFLISENAGYINGDCITMDGGEWLAGAGQFNMLRQLDDSVWDQLEKQARKK